MIYELKDSSKAAPVFAGWADVDAGVLACLDKKTGETVWEHKAPYAWSSPVCVYNEDGSGRVFYAVSSGKMYLLDGLTGEQLDKLEIPDGSIEASPAVYEDRVVIGTRGQSIRGLRLKCPGPGKQGPVLP